MVHFCSADVSDCSSRKKRVCRNLQKTTKLSHLHIQHQYINVNESVLIIIIILGNDRPDHGVCSTQFHLVESSWSTSKLGAWECSITSMKAKTPVFFLEKTASVQRNISITLCLFIILLRIPIIINQYQNINNDEV